MNDREPWLSDSEQHAWRTWLQIHRDLHVVLAKDLQASSDISYSDFIVLVKLSETAEGRLRITDLAAELSWDRSRVSHHLKRMEGRDLVYRTDCADDGRVAYIAITENGWRAIEQAAPRHAALVRSIVFEGMSTEDLVAFERLNNGIRERLERHSS